MFEPDAFHVPSDPPARAGGRWPPRPPGCRRRRLGLALLGGLALPWALRVRAHGPTPQKVDESVEIAAPPAAVWALVGEFGRFADWNPSLAACSAPQGNSVGSQRMLTLAGGGVLTEELDDHDPAGMAYGYRSGRQLDPAVLPASSYSVRLRVLPSGIGSRLEWRARGYRADTGNEPAAGRDDAAAVAALQAYIRPALAAAKQRLESK